MKPLSLYRQQLTTLYTQRAGLDTDIAQVIAEAVLAGHNIHDVLDWSDGPAQEAFDL